MVKKNFYYCLAPAGDVYQAVSLRQSDEHDYEVEWVDELTAEPSLAHPHWREIVRHDDHAMLLLPDTQVPLQQMHLPPLRLKEKRSAITGLLRKQRTQTKQEWYIDYRAFPTQKQKGAADPRQLNSVLCIDKVELDLHRFLFGKIGLRPRYALSSSLALAHLLRMQHPELDTDESEAGWNMVFLGENEHFLVIGGAVGSLIIRSLPADLSGAENRGEYISRLQTEVERSVFFARQHEIPLNIQRIFVAGNPELCDPLHTRLAQLEEVQVKRWRPEERFMFDGQAVEWRLAPLLAGAVAAESGAEFNLMPSRLKDQMTWRIGRYALLGASTAALFLLPLLIAGSILTQNVQDDVSSQQALQFAHSRNHAELLAQDYLRNINLLSRDEFLGEFGPGRANLAVFLRDLSNRTPSTVALTGLEIVRENDDFRITIDGECPSSSSDRAQQEFLRFQEALSESALLQGGSEPIFLEISSLEKDEEGSLVKFKLTYLISKELKG